VIGSAAAVPVYCHVERSETSLTLSQTDDLRFFASLRMTRAA